MTTETRHGRGAYVAGCRCEVCRKANRDYQRAYMARWENAEPVRQAAHRHRGHLGHRRSSHTRLYDCPFCEVAS